MLNWLYEIISNVSGGWLIVILISIFIIGVIILIKGADIFVSGSSSLAKKMKIPSIIIGLTIVSFGTSAPEASVSITAALNHSADLAIGNVVGSNICNILLVLGLPALFTPLFLNKAEFKKEIIIMILSSLLLLLFCIIIDVDNQNGLAFIEGIIFSIGIVLYVIFNVIEAKKHESLQITETLDSSSIKNEEEKEEKPKKVFIIISMIIIGLFGVLLGGDLVTYSAKNIAIKLNISEVLVGLTVVAVCTSLPELVTSLVAAKKNENDIAIGNVVGSNIFNILFILGITSIITPLHLESIILIDIIITVILSVLLLVIYKFKGKIGRNIGFSMILLYVGYVVFLVLRETVLMW